MANEFDVIDNPVLGIKPRPLYLDSGTAESRVRRGISTQRSPNDVQTLDDLQSLADKYAPYEKRGAPTLLQQSTPVAPPPEDQSNFSRGFDVAGKQLAQTAYGAVGLLGDTFGSSSLKEYGLKGYEEKSKEIQGISKDSDYFSNMMSGKGGLMDWLSYNSGYLVGQVAESAGVALIGYGVGAAAGAASGPGALVTGAAGAVGGVIEKEAVKRGIQGLVANLVEKEAAKRIATGTATELAYSGALKSVYGKAGALTATQFLNMTQELGSIYGDAVEEASKTGQEYSLGKVWLAGTAASLVDTAVDSFAFGRVSKALGGDKAVKGVAMEAFKGGAVNALTEGTQTVIERWGANKDLASKEAFKEYIDSAAVGFLGGAYAGGGAGVLNKFSNKEDGAPVGTKTADPQGDSSINIDPQRLVQMGANDRGISVFAAMHQGATPEVQAKIESIVDASGRSVDFEQALQDPEKISAGQKIISVNRQYSDVVMNSVSAVTPESLQGIKPVSTETAQKTPQTTANQANDAIDPNESLQETAQTTANETINAIDPNQQQGQMVKVSATNKAQNKKQQTVEQAPSSTESTTLETNEEVVGSLVEPAKQTKGKRKRAATASAPVTTEQVEASTQNIVQLTTTAQEKISRGEALSEDEKTAIEQAIADGRKASAQAKATSARGQALADQADVKATELVDTDTVNQDDAGQTATLNISSPSIVNTLNQGTNEAPGAVQAKQVSKRQSTKERRADAKKVAQQQRDNARQDANEAFLDTLMDEVRSGNLVAADAKRQVTEARDRGVLNPVKAATLISKITRVEQDIAKNQESQGSEATTNLLKQEFAKLDVKQQDDQAAADKAKRTPTRGLVKKEVLTEEIGAINGYVNQIIRKVEELKGNTSDKATLTLGNLANEVSKRADALAPNTSISVWAKGSLTTLAQKIRNAQKTSEGRDRTKTSDSQRQAENSLDDVLSQGRRTMEYGNKTIEAISNRDEKAEVDEVLFTPKAVEENNVPKVGRKKQSKDVINVFAGKPFAEFGLDEFVETKDQETFLAGGGMGYLSANNWFKSLDAALRKASKNKDTELRQNILDSIKDSEMQKFNDWKQSRNKRLDLLKKATKEKSVKKEELEKLFNDPEFLFAGYVFNDFPSLRMFENPIGFFKDRGRDVAANDPVVVQVLRAGGGVNDSANKWYESVFTAIVVRPEMEGQLLSRMSNREVERYKAWEDRQARALDLARKLRQRGEQYKDLIDIIDEYGAESSGVEISYENLLGVIGDIERSRAVESMTDVTTDSGGRSMPNLFSRTLDVAGINPLSVAQVYAQVKELTRNWTNAPEVNVINNESELPKKLQNQIQDDLRENPSELPQGYFDQETGTVYIFANNIFSDGDVQFVLFHESYGHFGLRGLLGDALDPFLNRAYAKSKRVRDGAEEWLANNQTPGLSESERRLLAIEESLSNLNANGVEMGLFKELLLLVRNFAESNGWDSIVEYLDNVADIEMAAVLRQARSYVQDGGKPFTYSNSGIALFVKAGHMSTAMFDRFSTKFLLSGAGDNVAGSGLYFYSEESLGVGERYRKAFGEPKPFLTFSGIKGGVKSKTVAEWSESTLTGTSEEQILQGDVGDAFTDSLSLIFYSQDPTQTIQTSGTTEVLKNRFDNAKAEALLKVRDSLASMEENSIEYESLVAIETKLESLNPSSSIEPVSVYKYTVELNDADVAKFANWTLPLSQQPKEVKDFANANRSLLNNEFRTDAPFEDRTFADIYNAYTDSLQNQSFGTLPTDRAYALTAKKMVEAGIMGSIHNEFESGGKVHVAYSEKSITILNREINPKSSELSAETRPNLFSKQTQPVQMVANIGEKVHGLALYDPVMNEWAVFTHPNEDVRLGNYNTQYATNIADAISLLKSVQGVSVSSSKTFNGRIPISTPQNMVLTPNANDGKFKAYIRRQMRTAVIHAQNQYLPIKERVNFLAQKGYITDAQNAWQKLILYHGRTGAKLENFNNTFVKPIIDSAKELSNKGGTLQEVDDYIYALHAIERNQVLRNRNSKKDSGMSDADATAILASASGKSYFPQLQQISTVVQKMGKEKPELMYQASLISKEQRDALLKYDYYVNLSGLDALESQDIPNFGRRFNLRGPEIKATTGRTSRATNVLARTIADYEAKIIRSEKNRVALTVLDMINANPDPNFAVVNPIKRKTVLDKNGNVAHVGDPLWDQKAGTLVVKKNGQDIKIDFVDKGVNSFGSAVGGFYEASELSGFLQFMMKWNRMVSALVTVYAPDWAMVNGARDLQNAFLNSRADFGKDRAVSMARETMRSAGGAARYLMGKATPTDTYANYYDELRNAGGLTYFLSFDTVSDKAEKIEKAIESVNALKIPGLGIRKVLGALEGFNSVIEAAPRLAAYKVLRENGYSIDESAAYAKELTVNFNAKGKQQFLSAAYLFFNPAIQGSERIYRAFKNPATKKRAMQSAGALLALGYIASLYAVAAGGKDDDGVERIKKQPDYKRATSIVLPIPGSKTFLAIPLPYGWNFFYAAGVQLADVSFLGKSAMSAGIGTLKAGLEAFSPFGGNDSKTFIGWLGKTMTPSIGRPVVELMMNENRFGSPIFKETPAWVDAKPPKSQQFFDSTTFFSRMVTEKLNALGGGTRTLSADIKAFDVNPAAIDHAIQSYIPGLPAQLFKAADVAYRKSLGYDMPEKALPFLGRVTTTAPEGYDAGAIARFGEVVETNFKAMTTMSFEDQAKYNKKFPNIGDMHGVVGVYKSFVNEQRTAMKEIQEDRSIPEGEKIRLRNMSKKAERQMAEQMVKRAVELGYGKYF
jgi:hypothetical protein